MVDKMSRLKKKMFLATVFCSFFLFPIQLVAECCPGMFLGGYQVCKDGYRTWNCCGKGACNIFCCNCDGGCRVPQNCTGWDKYCEGQVTDCEYNCNKYDTTCLQNCINDMDSCKKNCPVKKNGLVNHNLLNKVHFSHQKKKQNDCQKIKKFIDQIPPVR